MRAQARERAREREREEFPLNLGQSSQLKILNYARCMVELCQIMPDYFFIMPDYMPDLKEHIKCCLMVIFVMMNEALRFFYQFC